MKIARNAIASLVALGSMATVAFGADLGRGSIKDDFDAPVENKLFYGSLSGGIDSSDQSGIAGLAIGYQLNKFLAVELTYDHAFGFDGDNVVSTLVDQYDQFGINAVLGYDIGRLTPYILAGVGYQWTILDREVIYVLGGGVKLDLTPTKQLDLRFRHIEKQDAVAFFADDSSNLLTAGLTFKF